MRVYKRKKKPMPLPDLSKNVTSRPIFESYFFFHLLTATPQFPSDSLSQSSPIEFRFFTIELFLNKKHFAVSLQCLKKNLRVHLWSIFYWVEFLQTDRE